jgi:hypothetical protein
VDELYQGALESRQAGNLEDAMTQLELALARDPMHPGIKRELREVQGQLRQAREHAMEQMVTQVVNGHGRKPSSLSASGERAPRAEMPLWRKTLAMRRESRPLRVPDPWKNGVQWFYIFGPEGRQTDGADDRPGDPLVLYMELPRETKSSVSIRVIDADTQGHRDEMNGGWNTSTSFGVYGRTQLDSRIVGPHEPDGTVVEFGPFSPDQGDPQGDQVVFHLEVAGVAGDDNNLFSVEVLPARVSAWGITLDDAVYGRFASARRLTIRPSIYALLQGKIAVNVSHEVECETLVIFSVSGKHARDRLFDRQIRDESFCLDLQTRKRLIARCENSAQGSPYEIGRRIRRLEVDRKSSQDLAAQRIQL